MSVRMRVILEIVYDGATDEEDEEIRSHLASFVHASAASGMLTNDTLDAQNVKVTDVAAACERLLDAPPEPESEEAV